MFLQLPTPKPIILPNLDIPSPRNHDSLVNPDLFFTEFGRNKVLNKLDENGDPITIFKRNEFRVVTWLTLDNIVAGYIREHTNSQNWGLYKTAFDYNKVDPYLADLRGDFFLDFDDEDDIRKAQQDALHIIQHLMYSPNYRIPSNMIRVYFSGKKGIHLTIPYQVFGIDWHHNLDQVYRIMAEELQPFAPNQTLDMKVYERRRMFRLPGTRHASTGSFKVPMELKTLLAKTVDEIQTLSKTATYGSWIQYDEPRYIPESAKYFKSCEIKFMDRYKNMKFSRDDNDTVLDFEPPCYTLMMEEGPTKGSRNQVASMLVAFWRQRGLSEQDAWDNLIEWNDGNLPKRELKQLFNSNYKGNYVYGCRKIKENAVCPATCRADCKFFKSL